MKSVQSNKLPKFLENADVDLNGIGTAQDNAQRDEQMFAMEMDEWEKHRMRFVVVFNCFDIGILCPLIYVFPISTKMNAKLQ